MYAGMKATLTVARPGFTNYANNSKMIPAGSVVEVTGWSEVTQRFFGKSGGWSLCFSPDDATPEE